MHASENSPRQTAEVRERILQLHEALKKLPNKEACVFILKYIEGMSYEEIASNSGYSVNFTGVLLHRARKRLKSMLESESGAKKQQHSTGMCDVGKEKSRV